MRQRPPGRSTVKPALAATSDGDVTPESQASGFRPAPTQTRSSEAKAEAAR